MLRLARVHLALSHALAKELVHGGPGVHDGADRAVVDELQQSRHICESPWAIALLPRGRVAVGGGVVVGGSGFVRRYARAASTVASCIEMRLATKARLLPACFDERSARQAAIVALLLPLPRASHACSARSQRPPRDCRSSRSCARRPR